MANIDPSASLYYNLILGNGDLSNVTDLVFSGGDNVQIVATFDPSLSTAVAPSITLDPSGSIPIVSLQKMTVSGTSDTEFFYNYLVPVEGDGYQNISLHEGQNSITGELLTTINGGVLGDRAFIVTSNNNPRILTANLYSDNSYNAFYGVSGDSVTLQFVASEPLSLSVDPSVNFNVSGVSVSFEQITTTQTGLLNWQSTFDLSESRYVDGPVHFTIDYMDGGNNEGTFSSLTDPSNTVNGQVTYDKTPPVATLTLRDAGYTVWPGPFKAGDDVSMCIRFSELLNTTITPQISISGIADLFIDQSNLVKDMARSTATYDEFYYSWNVSSDFDLSMKLNITNARDLAGNLIETLSGGFISDSNRTFTIDNSAAIFQHLGIRSDNSYDVSLVKGGEYVFLDMSFNEDLSGLIATIGGVSVDFIQDISLAGRRVYTAYRNVSALELDRDLSFSVTATDKASNVVIRGSGNHTGSGVPFTINSVEQTTDISSSDKKGVRLDNTKPIVSDLSFYSNNTFFNTLATSKEKVSTSVSANTITAEFRTSEAILDPSSIVFSVNGITLNNDVSYKEVTTIADNSRHWIVYTDISYTDTNQGDISFSFLMTDLAGNEKSINDASLNAALTSSVKLDNVSPVFQFVEMSSSNTNLSNHAKTSENLYLDLSFNEAVHLQMLDVSFQIEGFNLSSGVITSAYANTDSSNLIRTTMPFLADHRQGNVNFSVFAKDSAGNESTTTTLLNSLLPHLAYDGDTPIINVLSFFKSGSTAQDKTWQVRPDNVIELMFTTDSKLQDISLSFKSNNQLVKQFDSLNLSGETIYTGRYTADYTDAEGLLAFDISATDMAGNLKEYRSTALDLSLSSADDISGFVFDLQPRAVVTYSDLADISAGAGEDISASFGGVPMYKGNHMIRINVAFDQSLNTADNSGVRPGITITHTKDDGTSVIDDTIFLTNLTTDNSLNFYHDYDLSSLIRPNYEAAVTMTSGHAATDMDPVKLDTSSGGLFSYVNYPKVTFSYTPYFDPFVTGTPRITATFAKTINLSGDTQIARLSGVEDTDIVLTSTGVSNQYFFDYTIPQGESGTETINLIGFYDDLSNFSMNVPSVGHYINGVFNIHHNRNFYIAGFDKDIQMTISGSIELGPDTLDRQDVSATAYVYLDTARLAHTFHFTTDATDVNGDNEVTDVQFDISTGSFTGLFNSAENSLLGNSQVAYDNTSLANVPKIPTTFTRDNANTEFSKGTRAIKYDVVRDLAFQLFNTHHAADLFQNEVALRNDIHDIINALVSTNKTEGITKVVEDCSRATYEGTNTANIGSDILRQMIKSANTSLALVQDPSGCTTGLLSGADMSNLYKMPFQDGDVVQFILNVAGAPDQKRLVGGTGTTHRRYDIRLIADPNPTTQNVDPSNNDL